ncbi:MAG: MupG family TIM beta-alpha barrel fold protein [Leptotrichiaceae bacterium]|nr:MupG family TIM beta-alpha barrel fold protein [Leptotrichiaceae bacterium]
MRKLGISIYPEKTTEEKLYRYIDKAAEAGFSRIFSCLLSVTDKKEKIKENFKKINSYAKSKGFEIILDVNPRVFSDLEISYEDLSFFKEIEADGIRLDMGFTGLQESLMTFKGQGLKIEINMSMDTHYIDIIMDYRPNKENLIGCHNFYPHAYTGLGMDFFNRCTERFTKYGLRTAAFITSQAENTFGPWPVTQGLPTLEMHRYLPVETQFRHYAALETVDDIIISNCYPTDEELEKLKNIRKDMASFAVELIPDIPETERKIVMEELHFNRGDVSGNVIRSTNSRVKYKGHNFRLFNTPEVIKRGDIVIESSDYGHYAGELMIALKEMKNTGKSNVVGKIVEHEQFILDYIKPWQKFAFSEK